MDVHFTYTRDGRPSGEAYIELESEQDVQGALGKNQQHMGKRYIEGIITFSFKNWLISCVMFLTHLSEIWTLCSKNESKRPFKIIIIQFVSFWSET